jgi:hypothetical protein
LHLDQRKLIGKLDATKFQEQVSPLESMSKKFDIISNRSGTTNGNFIKSNQIVSLDNFKNTAAML